MNVIKGQIPAFSNR